MTIPRSQLLLISSAGDYSEVFYERGDRLEKALLRNRISNLEQALEAFPEIIRCHRKYIINVDKLFHLNNAIPVSKSYAKAVNQARMT